MLASNHAFFYEDAFVSITKPFRHYEHKLRAQNMLKYERSCANIHTPPRFRLELSANAAAQPSAVATMLCQVSSCPILLLSGASTCQSCGEAASTALLLCYEAHATGARACLQGAAVAALCFSGRASDLR